MFEYNSNNKRDISFHAILPKLRYKKGNIFYFPSKEIRTKFNNKVEYKKEFMISEIADSSKINILDYKLDCTIIKEELDNGLKILIKTESFDNIGISDKQKIARAIEGIILNNNIMDDEDNEDFYNDYYENKINDNLEELIDDYSENVIGNSNQKVDNIIESNDVNNIYKDSYDIFDRD